MLTPVAPLRPRKNPPQRYARLGPPPATPVALVLVAASYNHDDGPVLILTFDRAIDISGVIGSQIVVDDADDSGLRFTATGGATLDSPDVARLVLVEAGDATGVGTTLTAAAGNGIVAAGDAGAWAGATDLELPYP